MSGKVLYGAGGRKLSTEVWSKCSALEGRWLRPSTPYARLRGRPRQEWGPAATRAAAPTLEGWASRRFRKEHAGRCVSARAMWPGARQTTPQLPSCTGVIPFGGVLARRPGGGAMGGTGFQLAQRTQWRIGAMDRGAWSRVGAPSSARPRRGGGSSGPAAGSSSRSTIPRTTLPQPSLFISLSCSCASSLAPRCPA